MSDAGKSEAKVYEPMTLWMARRGSAQDLPPTAEDLVKTKMKEKFNLDVNIDNIDKNTYEEKTNAMLAAGDYPDLVWIPDYNKQVQAIQAGIFLPVTNIIKNDPDWSKVDPLYLKGGLHNGEYYTLIDMKNLSEVIHFRGDWAANLNLKTPTNPDELYEMLHAFAKRDPDGNGKDDTYGFSTFLNSSEMAYGKDALWSMFLPGSGIFYHDKTADNIKSTLLLAEDMKKALSWFNRAYTEGVLDKEFILHKQLDAQNKFVTGKTGMWITGVQSVLPYYEKLKESFPDADAVCIPTFNGTYGPIYRADGTRTIGYFLTKGCKDPERGMAFMAYFFGPEGLYDISFGEEGKSYKIDNGKLVWLMDEAKKLYNPSRFISSVHDVKLPEAIPILERNTNNAKGYVYFENITSYLSQSQTYKAGFTDIKKLMSEKVAKFIIGELPVEKYDEVLQEARKIGLDDMLKEANEAYKAGKK